MTTQALSAETVQALIDRWRRSGAAERAGAQIDVAIHTIDIPSAMDTRLSGSFTRHSGKKSGLVNFLEGVPGLDAFVNLFAN